MCMESGMWLIGPLMFLGIIILCMVFSRRRGRWSCCSPLNSRSHHSDRIGKLEEEIQKLKEQK